MRARHLIFVSSTSDLMDERSAIENALRDHFDPYLYERDRSRKGSPRVRCRDVIEEADVFLCILGSAYGSVYQPGEDETSIVEWEFKTAKSRRDLEIMSFIKRHPPEISVDPRQRQFIENVSDFHKGVWCQFFRTTEELIDQARDSLQGWSLELFTRLREANERRSRRVTRYLTAIVALTALFVMSVAAVALTTEAVSKSAVLAFSGTGLIVIVACFILLWSETGG